MRTGGIEQRVQVTNSRKEGVEAAESHCRSGLGGYDLANLCQINVKRKAYFISSLYGLGLIYY